MLSFVLNKTTQILLVPMGLDYNASHAAGYLLTFMPVETENIPASVCCQTLNREFFLLNLFVLLKQPGVLIFKGW